MMRRETGWGVGPMEGKQEGATGRKPFQKGRIWLFPGP